MKGCALAFAMLITTPVEAEPLRTARVVAAGACDLAMLESRSNELLGRTAISPDASARVGIFTAEEDEGLSATLTFVDIDGVAQPARTVSAPSCEELVESLAVVISLVLRPEAAPPPPLPPPDPAPTVEPDDTAYQPLSPAGRRTIVEVGAARGTTSESALVIGGRFEYARTALGVELRAMAPSTNEIGRGSVHVMSARLDAAGCVHLRGFGACMLVMAGLVRARGEELTEARSAVRPVAGIGARLEWRQRVSRRLGMRVFADFEQLLATTRFLVDDMPVWTSDPRQAWLGAGIYFHLP